MVEVLSTAPRAAPQADRDHIANISNMIKRTYEADKKSPSQIGRWDRLTGRFRYGTIGIVGNTQMQLKLAIGL